MKFFQYGKDGGRESTVSGFWFIELKNLFSVVLLKFDDGSREAYHSHAFNCYNWLLSGKLIEYHINGDVVTYRPSIFGFFVGRETFHKVVSYGTSYVLSFRGPWSKTWKEYIPSQDKYLTLANGRKEIE